MQTPEALIQAGYLEWCNDWNKMAREAFKVKLDPEQQAILEAVQVGRRISVRAGTSRGKDYVGAVAALCFLYTNFPAKVILTAPTERQVRLIMMPEIDTVVRNAAFKLPGRMLGQQIRFADKRHYLVGFKARSGDIESWSGFHSPNLMVVITEASGIEETTFEAIEGILQGNSRLLIIFNPNQRRGESYKSVKSPQYTRFKMNCLEAPNVVAKKIIYPGQTDWRWVDERVHMPGWCMPIDKTDFKTDPLDFEWEGKFYRPNDLFRIKVMGEFPREGDNKLIPLEWVEAAQHRYNEHVQAGIINKGNICYGADAAGMGRDRTMICKRQDDFVSPFIEEMTTGPLIHMATAGRIKSLVEHTGRPCFIDTIGEGAGVYSRLVELKVKEAVSAKFSEVRKSLRDKTGQIEFLNMRAYCYYAIRDWLNPAFDSKAMLPPDAELTAQLNEPKFMYTSNGRVQIEAKEQIKKRLGVSPDKADALALTFWPYNPVVDNRVQMTKEKLGIF